MEHEDSLKGPFPDAFNTAWRAYTLEVGVKDIPEEAHLAVSRVTLDVIKVLRERYAKKIEDYIIYTGPGGFDPEPVQKILAEMIRADV